MRQRRSAARSALAPLAALAALALFASPSMAAWSNSGNVVRGTAIDESMNRSGAEFNPMVAPDGAGGLYAVWRFSNNDSLRINRLSGATGLPLWGADGVLVNEGGNVSANVMLLPDGAGGVWVCWQDQRTGAAGFYVQRYGRDGVAKGTGGGFFAVGNQGGGQPSNFAIARGATTDRLYIAYSLTANQQRELVRVRMQGNGFLPSIELPGGVPIGDDITLGEMQLHPDGAGGVIAVWLSGNFVKASRLNSAGTKQWGNAGVVVQNAAGVTPSQIWSFFDGTSTFVTWLHGAATNGIHAQKIDLVGALQWGASTTGTTVMNELDNGTFDNWGGIIRMQRCVPDGAGGMWVGWVDARDYNRLASNGFAHAQDLYCQRLDGAGALQLAVNGAPVDTMPGSSIELSAVPGGDGAPFFVYRSLLYEASTKGDIIVHKTAPNGTRAWNDIVNKSGSPTTDDNKQSDATAAADGYGGVVLAWDDERQAVGNIDVYATQRSADGSQAGPGLTLVAPNGGGTLTPLSTTSIQWTSTQLPATDNVRLEYSLAGQPRVTIVAATPNDGAFSWLVPDLRSTSVKIHVSSMPDGAPADSSDAAFAVCSPLALADSIGTFDAPNDIRAADLNEDHILDAVVPTATGAVVLIGLGSGGVPSGGFAPPVALPLGTGGRDVAIEDFDADGILDLAITTTNGVSVLPGAGTGGVGSGAFGAPVNHPAQSGPRGIAAADFDADGILDLAVVNGVSNTLSILLGNGVNGDGDGTFAAALNFPIGANAQKVAVADFNEDGVWDLATTSNLAAGSVSVLIGNSNAGRWAGTFAPVAAYPVGANPIGLVTGDFDADGITDIATADNSATDGVSVLLGNGAGATGDGTFAAAVDYPYGGASRDVETADVNQDGRTDLVVASSSLNAMIVLFADGAPAPDGTFTPGTPFYLGVLPGALALGDFNGDGAIDLLSANITGDNVSIVEAACGSGAATVQMLLPAPAGYHRIGDPLDLTWTRSAAVPFVDLEVSRDGGLNWETIARRQTGSLFAWRVTPPATALGRFRVVDGGRGRLADPSDGPSAFADGAVLLRESTAADSIRGLGLDPDTIRWVAAASVSNVRLEFALQGQPRQLIVASTPNDGEFRWSSPNLSGAGRLFASDAAAPASAADSSDRLIQFCPRLGNPVSETTTDPGALVAGDFSGDGILDLAIGGQDVIETKRGLGSGGVGDGAFEPAALAATLPANTTVLDLDTGDFNDDGILDLVVAAKTRLLVLLGGGGNHSGPLSFAGTVLDGAHGYLAVRVADFDEDGIEDIAAVQSAASTCSLRVFLGTGSGGTGTGTFAAAVNGSVLPLTATVRDLVVADFNEDGVWDLAALSSAGVGRVEVMRGRGVGPNGDGTFDNPVGYTAKAGGTTLHAADFDGDGILDLAAGGAGLVQWLRGLGTAGVGNGAFAPVAFKSATPSPGPLAIANLDGNAFPDLVGYGGTSGARSVVGYTWEGAAGLTPSGDFPFGLGSDGSLVCADFNADAAFDLASTVNGGVQVVLGDACSTMPGTVTIVEPAPGGPAAAKPAGGEGARAASVNVGDEHTIEWVREPGVLLVDLMVSRDGGSRWETIARGVPGSSFQWTVTLPVTDDLRFGVADATRRGGPLSTSTSPLVVTGGNVDAPAPRGPSPTAFSAPRPNPARGAVTFDLSLPRDADVAVEAFDLTGRRVAEVARGRMPAGEHHLRWPDADRLPPGVYLVRARWAGFEATRRLVRMD